MKSHHRKAFTQIELIFVMIVVGILAVVAIPRLAASRDDASAAKCTQEVQQLISEVSHHYTNLGYSEFSVKPIGDMTNLRTGIVEGDGLSSSQETLIENGITYMCDSEDIFLVKGALIGGLEYNLTVTDLNPTTSAAKTASELIRKLNDINTVGGSRNYKLQ